MKRFLAMLLTLVMLTSMVSIPAYAEEQTMSIVDVTDMIIDEINEGTNEEDNNDDYSEEDFIFDGQDMMIEETTEIDSVVEPEIEEDEEIVADEEIIEDEEIVEDEEETEVGSEEGEQLPDMGPAPELAVAVTEGTFSIE